MHGVTATLEDSRYTDHKMLVIKVGTQEVVRQFLNASSRSAIGEWLEEIERLRRSHEQEV